MYVLAAALALLAGPAFAASPAAIVEGTPTAAAVTEPPAAAAPVAPVTATGSPDAVAPQAAVEAPVASEGAGQAPKKDSVAPTQALLDKMGQGDRMVLAGDHRGALFVYQDAVYLQPRYAPARVRLGRAYLALRYPEQAIAQAEAALAEDPESAEARKLLEDARNAPPRPKPGAVAAEPPVQPAPAPAKAGPRVFKLPPAAEGPGAPPSRASPSTGLGVPGAVAAPLAVAPPVAVSEVSGPAAHPGPAGTGAPAEPAAQPQVAAQHYRTALGFLQNREWGRAVAALSDAILADPSLAVAYAARGSAQFGLGKYRDAAEDYAAAIRLDGNLGTPVYGLAECYRVLGEGKKAAEMYERYARSTSSDVREDLRAIATKRAKELR